MKRIIVPLLLFLFLFSSCKKQSEQKFLDFAAMDTTVKPQDNFFMYANGTWIKNTQIPASESGWGSFYILNEKATFNLHALLNEVSASTAEHKKGSPGQLIGDLFSSAMDSLKIETMGYEPLKEGLERIQAIGNPQQVLDEITYHITTGAVPLAYGLVPSHYIIFYVYLDDKNSDLNVVHFDQGDLGLPTKDYYTNMDSISVSIRDAYLKYIANFFKLTGSDEVTAMKKAGEVLALETRLAAASKGPVELRDPVANYNKFSVEQLESMMPKLQWAVLLKNLKVTTDTLLMGQPGYYQAFEKELFSTPLDVWKDLLAFQLIKSNASALSNAFVMNNFEFYGKTLQGLKEMKPRWKRMSQMVDDQLPDALGRLYVEKYFPPEAKQRMDELVDNLFKAYKERIEQAAWMGDSTKEKAIGKLEAITRKIGYPDKWEDYKGVEINSDSYLANLGSTRRYAYNEMISKLGKGPDPNDWLMSAPTVNAYYSANNNEIVFPAGILQPPFFHKDADDAINYGAIGTVIGHEVTHGFDDKGRLFDANGNLQEWWTAEDAEKYMKEAAKIVRQYNEYTVLDDLHLNGELTQGENIADLGGLLISYNAFKMTDQGKSDELIDGLTPDQRFFLSYAQVWQIKNTDESTRQQVLTDPHSPAVHRVNGPLTNLPEFYAAFSVTEGDKLYKADSLHIRIW